MGSNPIIHPNKFKRLVGGSGRRDRLKIYSPFGDAGSIPALSIILLYL